MRVKIKNYLRRRVLVLFLFLQNLNNFKRKSKRLLSYNLPIKINFLITILRDKPYFGINYTANQVWPERKPIMESLIDDEIKKSKDKPFKALEIGTWGGASAIIWAQACKRKLLKIDGIICGDDYELSLTQIDLEHAKAHSEKDLITDPATGEQFHPGITLAIAEIFGNVSMEKGFWAIRKTGSGWEKVNLDFSQNYV